MSNYGAKTINEKKIIELREKIMIIERDYWVTQTKLLPHQQSVWDACAETKRKVFNGESLSVPKNKFVVMQWGNGVWKSFTLYYIVTCFAIGRQYSKYNIPYDNIGVLTGPCHAEEVAMERLSYLTLACGDKEKAKLMAKNVSSDYIKTKTSDDIIGTEYAAMLKNIYAISAGIAHGLGYGDNFQSVLMSNSIREMNRFIKKVHQMKRNINNSAYLGDLLVTGYSTFSRNRMFGNMIGKGYTVKSAMLEMSMVAEGYYATKSAKKIKEENGAVTPIIDAVYSVLYKGKDAKRVFEELTKQID